MFGFGAKKFLIPFATVLLLLAVDGYAIVSVDNPPFLYQNSAGLKFPAFRTKDLRGNAVTQDIFKGKFTVVCLWVAQDATDSKKFWTDICAWQDSVTAPIQFIGIVGDMKCEADAGKLAVAQSVAANCPNVTHIIPNDDLTDILSRIRNAPTVFFVNDEGYLVGQPVVGSEPDLVKKEIMRLINANSKQGIREKIQTYLFCRP